MEYFFIVFALSQEQARIKKGIFNYQQTFGRKCKEKKVLAYRSVYESIKNNASHFCQRRLHPGKSEMFKLLECTSGYI